MKKFLILILSIICALSTTFAVGCIMVGDTSNTGNNGNSSTSGDNTGDNGDNDGDDDTGDSGNSGNQGDTGDSGDGDDGNDDDEDLPQAGDFTIDDMFVSLDRMVTIQPVFSLSAYEIVYTSDNTNIVSVNGSVLTAKAVGTAHITATPANGVAPKTFTVKVVPSTFTVPALVIEKGYKEVVTPEFEVPSNQTAIAYTCASSGITINGNVITGNENGTYTVTAQTAYYNQDFTVTVKQNSSIAGHLNTLNQRIAEKANWVDKENLTLCVGDSGMDPYYMITKSGFLRDYFAGQNIETIGVGGTYAEEWYWLNQTYDLGFEPKNLVVHLGSNDVFGKKYSAQETATYLIRALEQFHEMFPNSNMYWFAVKPRIYEAHSYDGNKVVAETNEIMHEYCANNSWVVMVDSEHILLEDATSGNSQYYIIDNIHLNYKGYKVLFDLAIEAGLEVENIPVDPIEFDIPNLLVYQGYYVKVPTLSEGTPTFSNYNGITISDGKVYAGDTLTAGTYTVKATIDGLYFDTFSVEVRDPNAVYGTNNGTMNSGIAMHNTGSGGNLATGTGSTVQTHKAVIDSHTWDEDELTLFFGDSFTDYNWFLRDFYTTRYAGYNAETVGISSSRAEQWIWFIQDLVLPYKPKTIISHIGTNDLFDGKRTPATVIESVTTLFELIHEDLPETKVWWWTIEDRCSQSARASDITDANNGIIAWAADKDWFTVVDTRSLLISNDSKYGDKTKYDSSLWNDSIHPSCPKGYDLLINATYAAGCPKPTDNSHYDGAKFAVKDYTGGSWQGENLGVVKEFLYTATVTTDPTLTGSWRRHVSFNLNNSGSKARFLIYDNNKDGTFGYYTHIEGATSSTGSDYIDSSKFTLKVLVTDDSLFLYLNDILRAAIINVSGVTAGASVGFEQMSATLSNQMIYSSTTDEYKMYRESTRVKALESQYTSSNQSVINIASSSGLSNYSVAAGSESTNNWNAIKTGYTKNFLYTARLNAGTQGGGWYRHLSININGSSSSRFMIGDKGYNDSFEFWTILSSSAESLATDSLERSTLTIQVLVTDDSAYLFVNGVLRCALINIGELTSEMTLGTQFMVCSIENQQIFAIGSQEYDELSSSKQIQDLESQYASSSNVALYDLGVGGLGDYIVTDTSVNNWDAVTISDATTNYLYTADVTINGYASNGHVSLNFNGASNSRFLIWDDDNDGLFRATVSYEASAEQYNMKDTDKTLSIAVLVIGNNAYLFIDGELVCAYIYIASSLTSFSIGTQGISCEFTDQALYQSNTTEYSTYTAKADVASYQSQYASSTTTQKIVDINA